MREKEINKLADIISEKVVNMLEDKQQQWDIEFHNDLGHFVTDTSATKKASNEEVLLEELEALKLLLSQYKFYEEYEKCLSVEKEIKDIKSKLKKL